MRNLYIGLLLMLSGFMILIHNYYMAYKGTILFVEFWLGIIVATVSVIIIITKVRKSNIILIFLFLYGLLLYSTFFLRSPDFLYFQDEMIHWQATNLILDSGTTNGIATIQPLDKWYPGLSIFASVIVNVLGTPLINVARILTILTHSSILIFLFLFVHNISHNRKISAMAALLYCANPEYIFFDSAFSYESLAIALYVLILFLVSKKIKNQTISMSILIIISLFALAITHHVTSMVMIVFLIILLINKYLFSLNRINSLYYLVGIGFCFVASWIIYNANDAVCYLNGVLTARIQSFINTVIFETEGKQLFRHSLLPSYEIAIDKYIYPSLIIILSLIGMFFYLKEKTGNKLISHSLIVWSFCYFATWPFMMTRGAELAIRLWATLFIGVIVWLSIVLNKLLDIKRLKALALVVLILLIVGGISIGSNEERRYPLIRSAGGGGALTKDVVNSCNWYSKQFGYYNKIAGDRTIYFIFGQYGRQYVDMQNSWKVFYPIKNEKNLYSLISEYEAIIVDYRITQYLANAKSYFSQESLPTKYPDYGRSVTFPIQLIKKFDDVTILNMIYANGNIAIYNR